MADERIKSSTEIAAHVGVLELIAPNALSEIESAVNKLMKNWPNDRGIYVQLQRLAEFISKTRTELATLRPAEVKREFIPKATDELDAIVEATASATHRIMDAADVVMEVAGSLPKAESDKIMAAVTSIYEACTFQDITGQRVTKIVGVLKVIEERVDRMVGALGELDAAPAGTAPEAPVQQAPPPSSQADIDALFASPAAAPGGSTLEGPALPGKGSSQADVDAILSGKG